MRLQLDSFAAGATDGARVGQVATPGANSGSRATPGRDIDAAGDSIGISGTSSALSRLSGARADRIQQLTSAVRAGTYQVPGAALSGAIVSQAFVSGAAE